jgi:hypothetical protein
MLPRSLAPTVFFPFPAAFAVPDNSTDSWSIAIAVLHRPATILPQCTGLGPLGGKRRGLPAEPWRKDRKPCSLVVGQRQAGFGRRMVAMRDMDCGPPRNPNLCSQLIRSNISVLGYTMILQLQAVVRKFCNCTPENRIFLFLGVLPEIFSTHKTVTQHVRI